MTEGKAGSPSLWRLGFMISSVWSLAWWVGLSSLVFLAVELNERLVTQDLEARLEVYAAATYGLTWFDEQGRFHDEIWREDAVAWPEDLEVWVVRPSLPPLYYLQPKDPRFHPLDLLAIAQQVIRTEEEFYQSGKDASGQAFQLYAMPTYQDGHISQPWAAVVVVGDAEPSRREHFLFSRRLILGAVLLGLVGLVLAALLARWSLRPVARSFQQRERFLMAAAHELRTPLATLQSVCESATAGDEPAAKALDRLVPLVRRAGTTVDDLLLFARLEAGTCPLELQPVRLDLLVETCLPEEEDLQFEATPWVLQIDTRLMQVAVGNLIENAKLHGGGLAGISVKVEPGKILVQDRGPGFPETVLKARQEDLALAPSPRGTGLGLTLVHLVIALQGGTLRLSNSPQGGARAEINLGPRKQ